MPYYRRGYVMYESGGKACEWLVPGCEAWFA